MRERGDRTASLSGDHELLWHCTVGCKHPTVHSAGWTGRRALACPVGPAKPVQGAACDDMTAGSRLQHHAGHHALRFAGWRSARIVYGTTAHCCRHSKSAGPPLQSYSSSTVVAGCCLRARRCHPSPQLVWSPPKYPILPVNPLQLVQLPMFSPFLWPRSSPPAQGGAVKTSAAKACNAT